MKNFDSFHETMNHHSPDAELSRTEASEALHNLTGFMSLLIQINEREKVVPVTGQESGATHD